MRLTGWAAMLLLLLVPGTQVAVGQWVKLPTPVSSGDHWFFAGSTQHLYAASVAGVMLSTDNGAQWTDICNDLPDTYVTAVTVIGDTVLVGTHAGSAYRSADHGASWAAAGAGLSSAAIRVFAVSGHTVIAFVDSGVSVSTDRGTSWTSVSTNAGYGFVNDVIIDGPLILIGTDKGIFLSTDHGVLWTDAGAGLSNTDVRTFARRGDTLFAGTYGGGVFRTIGFGGTWVPMNDGLSTWNTHSLISNGSHLWVGTCYGGVFVFDTNEARWNPCSLGLTGAGLDVHALATTASTIVLGTMGEIWLRPLSEVYTSVASGSADAPGQFSLSQNYPNPFNPSTEITFSVGKGGPASLKVHDVLGREVATLFDGPAEDGRMYRVGFDGRGVASGVYVYRLVSGDRTDVKRMALVR